MDRREPRGLSQGSQGFIPGNKMVFVGVKKDDELADVIAYLKTPPGQ